MSVDRTIEELSGTLNQLGILVEHINNQIVGITSRINKTLDNFDTSVMNIATDAGSMTGQVGDTISQVPNAWVFYLLFITLIIVLILLSVLIIISLATRLHAIYHIIKGDRHSLVNSPYPSNYDSKQPLTLPISPVTDVKRRHHVTVPMQSEPRRYGENISYAQPQDPGFNAFFQKHNLQPPRNQESANEAYLRRPLNPTHTHTASAVTIDPPMPTPTPRYTKNIPYRGEPV
ncbi:unnamed protein product [Bursaphelenchus okinawaensis]|uniref:Uncharacterized protein n=1 Tax=Bursaphelenchus okinawaensis TaxID=465554 RepID=A0A811L2C3_9BILA|nr:unnamed protein product [Bursaphelenchus okinawaensis]CAG9117385.1 unnamed protein product [Bursaphelenchus okinawaensis]